MFFTTSTNGAMVKMITEEICCKRTLQSLGKELVNVYSFFALVEKVVYMPCGICHVEDYYAMSYRSCLLYTSFA